MDCCLTCRDLELAFWLSMKACFFLNLSFLITKHLFQCNLAILPIPVAEFILVNKKLTTTVSSVTVIKLQPIVSLADPSPTQSVKVSKW